MMPDYTKTFIEKYEARIGRKLKDRERGILAEMLVKFVGTVHGFEDRENQDDD